VDVRGVATIVLGFGKNKGNLWCPDFITGFNKLVDSVEADGKIVALVITGEGKYFSNGLDTKWLKKNTIIAPQMVVSTYRLMARILTLGVPTIAAINGHAMGAGVFLALSCDYRVMLDDSGHICLPELDLQMPLSPGYVAIVKCKLPKRALRTTVLAAKRWTPLEAAAAQIIDRVVTKPDAFLSSCRELAFEAAGGGRVQQRNRNVYSMLKREIYSECYETLTSWWALPSMLSTLLSLQIRRSFEPVVKRKTTSKL